MNMRAFVFSTVFILMGAFSSIEGALTLKNGKLVDASTIPTMSAQEHFNVGLEAIEARDWVAAALQFNIVALNFSGTECGKEAYFYLGVANFFLKEYDFSNEAFSNYLKVQSNPVFFQEAVEYKFAIANKLGKGAKRRYFGTKHLPKWACGKQMAIQIYDEVIAAVPCNEIAARALVSKGCLLWKLKDYRSTLEAFHLVIRRFPKHELAAECYILISKVYLEQCRQEFQNPDILALAQINLRKFTRDFPREERLAEVGQNLQAIKEINAKGLYDTGQFYERTYKKHAAMIYYKNAMFQFPGTHIAECCEERLRRLDPAYYESIKQNIQSDGMSREVEEYDDCNSQSFDL